MIRLIIDCSVFSGLPISQCERFQYVLAKHGEEIANQFTFEMVIPPEDTNDDRKYH